MTIDSKQEIRTGRKALGRGLAALIPEADFVDVATMPTTKPAEATKAMTNTAETPYFFW